MTNPNDPISCLTKRELFAVLLAVVVMSSISDDEDMKSIVKCADKLIEALNKGVSK